MGIFTEHRSSVSYYHMDVFYVSADKVSLGPGYKTFQQHCQSVRDCNAALGEVCWWLYDGCTRGQCMCHPRGHIQDQSGRCWPGKLVRFKCFYNG